MRKRQNGNLPDWPGRIRTEPEHAAPEKVYTLKKGRGAAAARGTINLSGVLDPNRAEGYTQKNAESKKGYNRKYKQTFRAGFYLL